MRMTITAEPLTSLPVYCTFDVPYEDLGLKLEDFTNRYITPAVAAMCARLNAKIDRDDELIHQETIRALRS